MASGDPPRRMTPTERTERMQRAAQDGAAARKDYDATVASVEENTARLRALRIERDRETAPAEPAKVRAPAAKRNRRNIPPG